MQTLDQANSRELLDESDAFEGPWISSVEEGTEVTFEIDRTKTFVVEIDNPFPESKKNRSATIKQVVAMMKNIVVAETGEDLEEDGEHVVPFWAGGPLKKALKSSKAKKWVKMAYYREAEEEDRGDRVVTINTANFAVLTD